MKSKAPALVNYLMNNKGAIEDAQEKQFIAVLGGTCDLGGELARRFAKASDLGSKPRSESVNRAAGAHHGQTRLVTVLHGSMRVVVRGLS